MQVTPASALQMVPPAPLTEDQKKAERDNQIRKQQLAKICDELCNLDKAREGDRTVMIYFNTKIRI